MTNKTGKREVGNDYLALRHAN